MNPFPDILSGCNGEFHCSNPGEGGVKKGLERVVEVQKHAKIATCPCSNHDLLFDKSAMLEFLIKLFCLLHFNAYILQYFSFSLTVRKASQSISTFVVFWTNRETSMLGQ